MQTKRVLAIVPARGGSKGVPRKNIRLLGAKPLIAHTLEAAQSAKHITRLIVSTDDEEIAAVAKSLNADVPFLRPEELAADLTPQLDVVLHAIEHVENEEQQLFEYILLLQATAPLRTTKDIDDSLELLFESACDSVISFTQVESGHPHLMVTLDGVGHPKEVFPIPEGVHSRQQYPDVYLRNGAIYAIRRDVLVEERSFFGEETRAYKMPFWRSVNIDTLADFALAEFFLEQENEQPSWWQDLIAKN